MSDYVRFRKNRVVDVRFQNTGTIFQETRNSRGICGKQREKHVETLVQLLWCAAAPGLKPLSLLRVRSPGTGEG